MGVSKPKFGGRPGTWRAGAWYNTSHADDVVLDRSGGLAVTSGLDPLRRDGHWGGWALVRQQVTGTADKDGAVRGLTLFTRATETGCRTVRLDSQISIGIFYEGLNGVAPDGVLGVALGRTHVNDRVGAAERRQNEPIEGSEVDDELLCSLHRIAGTVLLLNVQYVIRPGGCHDRGDAVVLGLRTALTL